ncbi:MAG: IPT/TIG domain-containing protein [Acidimicrobiales bacterium]
MSVRRAAKALAASAAATACVVASLAFATAAGATGPPNGSNVSGAAAAVTPFTAGVTFDSGQKVNIVIPANSNFVPNNKVFVLECAAPDGVNPTTIDSCDGNTNYASGSIFAGSDGSVNLSASGKRLYPIYALPDHLTLGETSSAANCGLGSANECVLYVGQGGGSDVGLSSPYFFSQPFEVHSDPTDSGTNNPGDGTFPADSAPAITSTSSTTFIEGTSNTFTVTATGWPPPTITETGTLPNGVSFNSSTGVLSGTPSGFGTFPISFDAGNGVSPDSVQSFNLTVEPGVSGETIPGAAAAVSPFTPGTFDSGQKINVVIPPNGVLAPNEKVYVLECAAPGGVDPTTIDSCDGNTNYATGTIFAGSDGSVNLSGTGKKLYPIYALPDHLTLGETSSAAHCGLGSANECVLYVGQGGGGDIGLTQPHFFSQPFEVHTDSTDSGTNNPGDGTFPADQAPAITSTSSTTFTANAADTFTVMATGFPPPTFSETGTLPDGVTLNATSGVLSGTPTESGDFPITIDASNGVSPDAIQDFDLTVNGSPSFTSASTATFLQGQDNTFTVMINGTPTPAISTTSDLDGLTLTDLGNGTATLTGDPTAPGSFLIVIQAQNSQGTTEQNFTLTVLPPPPTVTNVNPPSGPTAGGNSVTITGANLETASSVTFGSGTASISADMSGSITVTVPAGTSAGPVTVTVTTPSGSASGSYTYVDPLTVANVSPSVGPTAGGNSVTITGTNLDNASSVTFGANPAAITSDTSGSITVTVPTAASAGTVTVTVTTPGGSATGSYTYQDPPTVTTVNPPAGPIGGGNSVTITGTNLDNASSVTFGANAAAITSDTSGSSTVTVPAGASTGPVTVTVTTPGGSATGSYTYVNGPIVTSIFPTSGPTIGGTSVTITGSGFTGATAVDFGSNAATGVMVTSDTSITATSPAGAAGTVGVTVTTPVGTSTPSAASGFTYIAGFQITTASLPVGVKTQLYNGAPAGFTLHSAEAQPGATLKWKKLTSLPKGLKLKNGAILGTVSIKAVTATVKLEVTEKYKIGKTKFVVTAMRSWTLTIH